MLKLVKMKQLKFYDVKMNVDSCFFCLFFFFTPSEVVPFNNLKWNFPDI